MIGEAMANMFKMMAMGGMNMGGAIYVQDNSSRQFCSGGPSCAQVLKPKVIEHGEVWSMNNGWKVYLDVTELEVEIHKNHTPNRSLEDNAYCSAANW